MRVKDLPEGTNLTDIEIELPKNVLKQFKDYAGGEKIMYVAGQAMGDFFMSTKPKGKGERRLYPLPPMVEPKDILEWKVVTKKTKK